MLRRHPGRSGEEGEKRPVAGLELTVGELLSQRLTQQCQFPVASALFESSGSPRYSQRMPVNETDQKLDDGEELAVSRPSESESETDEPAESAPPESES